MVVDDTVVDVVGGGGGGAAVVTGGAVCVVVDCVVDVEGVEVGSVTLGCGRWRRVDVSFARLVTAGADERDPTTIAATTRPAASSSMPATRYARRPRRRRRSAGSCTVAVSSTNVGAEVPRSSSARSEAPSTGRAPGSFVSAAIASAARLP